jgi:hypothetical protein
MNETTTLILMLIVVLVLHLIEEIKTGFRKRFPLGDMSKSLFIGLNILIYAFCIVTFWLSFTNRRGAFPFA